MPDNRALDGTIRKFFSPDVGIGIARYILSFAGVLILGSILIMAQGEDPIRAARLIVYGALGNLVAIGNSLRWAMPCMLTGAASIIAMKSGVINLGIEGQMYVGAFTAAVLGWAVRLPPGVHVVVCIAGAGIAGVAWAIVPALMRLFLSVNEYVTTMMMNFIATLFCDYFVVWMIIPSSGITTTTAATPPIASGARLSTLIKGTSCSTGLIIGIAVCLLVCILYKYTIKGYELKQVGENLKFAKTGGVNVKKTFIIIFVLSGFLGGLSGGVEVTGGYYRYVSGFSYTMGWEGIMIANICNNNPIGLIFASIVWGGLKTGAMSMERGTTLNRLTVNLLQMFFVILVSINYEGIFRYFADRMKKRRQARRFLEGENRGGKSACSGM
ncbi:MAG: ABC transporter permease [Synergistaceae bacterium]|jgi:simple sugar transport system permease protein|nr:ABC transporter permease [Synergistaceae bacterium]